MRSPIWAELGPLKKTTDLAKLSKPTALFLVCYRTRRWLELGSGSVSEASLKLSSKYPSVFKIYNRL